MAPKGKVRAAHFSGDALQLMRLLGKHEVRYVIIGGEAVVYHGYPRFTGDIDFFYDPVESNARNLLNALSEFWNGQIPGVGGLQDLVDPGVIQFGRPPYRIDLLNQLDDLSFGEAWKSREPVEIAGAEESLLIFYLGKEALLKNKKATGRPKDLDDIQHLS